MNRFHLIFLFIISLSSQAEVTLDGTLGQSGALTGPEYLIEANLGQRQGSNLFHSFQDFNLQSHESATFTGPNNLNNIISRVTGGNPSEIDGLIRSTIPMADMYFINPYGIMFGENAKLDVQGSFHASTADYLRLGEGGRFNARHPMESLLSVAPIEAFGFLADSPASITTQDSDLSVYEGNSLSFIGGDLSLNGHSPILFHEQDFAPTTAIFARSKLSAPAGRLNLASVASQGEVIPSEFGLDLNAEGGTIATTHTLMDVSGQGGGAVFIRSGQFLMDNATIQANTMADQDGKGIDVKVTEILDIKGDFLSILSNTMGSGNAGIIRITVPDLRLVESFIRSSSFSNGDSGDIVIEAEKILLDKGGNINNDTFVNGQGGDITIKATESFSISGEEKQEVVLPGGITIQADIPSELTSETYGTGKPGHLNITTGLLNIQGGLISTNNFGLSKSADITVNADKINITGGGLIISSTFLDGEGGKININTNTMSIIGKRPGIIKVTEETFIDNNQSSIATISFGKGDADNISVVANELRIDERGGISAGTASEGAAGDVTVKVKNLFLEGGSEINSSSGGLIGEQILLGQGPGGNVHVIATNNITLSGQDNRGLPSAISTNSLGIGQGGHVTVETNELKMTDGAAITANAMGIGNAGNVTVQANTIKITNKGTITTSAEQASGGNISIAVPELLFLREAQMTTSVQGGSGDGGNITLSNPNFIVLDQSQIKAQANEGRGGNIELQAKQLVKSPESQISASSKLGIDGEVKIESPELELNAFIVVLPDAYVERPLSKACPEEIEEISLFRVERSSVGMPKTPDSFME